MKTPPFNSASLLKTWNNLAGLPAGKALFSRLLGLVVPYSGTLGATIEHLEAGRIRVRVPDRRRIRNHLDSFHAMALANAGELATGLAVITAIPETARAILVAFHVEYLKKGRGDLTVEAHQPLIADVKENTPVEVAATLKDAGGTEVTRVKATWLVGPKKGT